MKKKGYSRNKKKEVTVQHTWRDSKENAEKSDNT